MHLSNSTEVPLSVGNNTTLAGNATEPTKFQSFLANIERMASYWSANDDIKETNQNTRRKEMAVVLTIFLFIILSFIACIVVRKVRIAKELNENRRRLAEETRGFNSKYTPILGDE